MDRHSTYRPHSPRIRGAALVFLVGACLFALAPLAFVFGCASANKSAKDIVVALNELQDSAAKAYNDAKGQEASAGLACAAAARRAGVALPEVPRGATKDQGAAAVVACDALGARLPFNPATLRDLETPINATHGAIRAADAARRAALANGSGDASKAVAAAIEAISHLYAAAKELGLQLPFDQLAALKGRQP